MLPNSNQRHLTIYQPVAGSICFDKLEFISLRWYHNLCQYHNQGQGSQGEADWRNFNYDVDSLNLKRGLWWEETLFENNNQCGITSWGHNYEPASTIEWLILVFVQMRRNWCCFVVTGWWNHPWCWNYFSDCQLIFTICPRLRAVMQVISSFQINLFTAQLNKWNSTN